MFEDINRIKRTELAEDVQLDLLTESDHTKLDGFVVNPDGGMTFKYSLSIDVNGTPYNFNGTQDVDITITPETVGAATSDHTHPPQINITGNSATTDKLKIPVNIGNASFDGSADITLADMGASSVTHNHDTVYSKLDHNHDTDYSDINHNHDTVYSKLDHGHDYLYAGSATVGGPATSALKLDKEFTINVIGALSGSVSFTGDEGSVDLDVDLGTHNHLLSDIDFAGFSVVMDSSNIDLTTAQDPNATGIGSNIGGFEYHTVDSNNQFIILGLKNEVIDTPREFQGLAIKAGSQAIPNDPDNLEITGVVDNYILRLDYLNHNYELISSMTLDGTETSLAIPIGTKYIRAAARYMVYLYYNTDLEIESVDGGNIPYTCQYITTDISVTKCKFDSHLKSVKIITKTIHDWGSAFKDCINLEQVEIAIDYDGAIDLNHMFQNCSLLHELYINTGTSNIISAAEMFRGCISLLLPPDTLDYSRIGDMTGMFRESGIVKFPNDGRLNITDDVKIDYMFLDSGIFGGNLEIYSAYLDSNPTEFRVTKDIIKSPSVMEGFKINIVHQSNNPMDITFTSTRASAKIVNVISLLSSDGVLFKLDNSTNTITEFSFRINTNSAVAQTYTIITADVAADSTMTYTSSTVVINPGSNTTINKIPITASTVYISINGIDPVTFEYIDSLNIKEIEIGGSFSSVVRFSVLERATDWYPFVQSKGLEKFSVYWLYNINNFCKAFDGCTNLISVYIRDGILHYATDMSYMFNGCISLEYLPEPLISYSVTNINHIFTGCSMWFVGFGLGRLDIRTEDPMTPIESIHDATDTILEVAYLSTNEEVAKYVEANKDLVTGVIIDEYNVVSSGGSSGGSGLSYGGVPYYIEIAVGNITDSTNCLAVGFGIIESKEYYIELYNSSMEEIDTIKRDKSSSSVEIIIPSGVTQIKIIGDLTSFVINPNNTLPITSFRCPIMPNLQSFSLSRLKESLINIILGYNIIYFNNVKFTNFTKLEYVAIYMNYISGFDLSNMFSNCTSLLTCTLYGGGSVTDTSHLFDGDSLLTEVVLNIDTSNVANMSYMFNGCPSLLYISPLDTSNVTNMNHMFSDCSYLTSIPLSDTSKVTDMGDMFRKCTLLTSIPLLDTSNVTNMEETFKGCRAITTIPLLDTSNVTNMGNIFEGCTKLTTIPLINTSKATSIYGMFYDCIALQSIPLLDISKANSTDYMFFNCTSLTTIPLLDTSNVTDMNSMFYNCTSLTTIPLLDTSKVTSISSMFYNCSSLTNVPFFNTVNVVDMVGTFSGCTSLTTIPLLNTCKVTSMNGIFKDCTSLTTIPLLDTSKVTDTIYMLNGCSALTSIPMFDLSNITNCSNMISHIPSTGLNLYIAPQDASKIGALDISNIIDKTNNPDISKVKLFFNNILEGSGKVDAFRTAYPEAFKLNITNTIMLGIKTYDSTATVFAGIADAIASTVSLSIDVLGLNKDDTVNMTTYTTTSGVGVNISSNITANTRYVLIKFIRSDGDSGISTPIISNVAALTQTTNMFSANFIDEAILFDFVTFSNANFFKTDLNNIAKAGIYYAGGFGADNYQLFNGCTHLETVYPLNCQYMTNIDSMFDGCSSLVNIPPFNTSNVIDTGFMFDGCSSLVNIPILDTSSVTRMRGMFYNCAALITIPELNTSNVTNMSSMFYGCTSLTTIPLLDTSKVTTMNAMFMVCKSLITVPLLDTSNVTDMDYMFGGCRSLTSIPLLNTSKVVTMGNMVNSCISLTTIPPLDTSNVTFMFAMFNNCPSLTIIPLLDTSNVTDMDSMFAGCTSLTYPNIPLLNTSKVVTMGNMFAWCNSLNTIPLFDTSKVTNMYQMFYMCYSLTTIPLLDTSKVTNMSYMFYECHSLTTIPKLNISSATTTEAMFSHCASLVTIPQLDILPNVTNMRFMFSECTSLIYVSKLNTPNAINLEYMFNKCSSMSSMQGMTNTSKVTNMNGMFRDCSELGYIPSLDFSSATDMSYMFKNCIKLEEATYITAPSVTNTSHMFEGCLSLERPPQNFGAPNVSNMRNMFKNCHNLLGTFKIDCTNTTVDLYLMFTCTIFHITLRYPVANTGITNSTYAFPSNVAKQTY